MKQLLGYLVRNVILNPIVLVSVAVASGLIGIFLILDTPAYARRLERAEQLRPSSAAALVASAPDREVLLEGRISSRNQASFEDFVAYVHEQYRDEAFDGDHLQAWVEVARATPPLWITLADGDVRIANHDYVFDSTPVTKILAEPTATKGAVQVRGYQVDSPVLVIGHVMPGGAVKAEFLYGGSRADYMADMRAAGSRSLPLGIVFLVVGLVAMATSAYQIRRFLAEIAAERAAEEAVAVATSARPHRKRRSVR